MNIETNNDWWHRHHCCPLRPQCHPHCHHRHYWSLLPRRRPADAAAVAIDDDIEIINDLSIYLLGDSRSPATRTSIAVAAAVDQRLAKRIAAVGYHNLLKIQTIN